MSTLSDRIAQARANARVHTPDARVQAGRQAEEEALRTLTRDLAEANHRIFRGVRLPSPDGLRRYELDFVIVSPRDAIVVELKNWSGEVRERGRVVEQVRRGGEVVDHGDVLGELAQKVAALGAHHRKSHRKTPPIRGLLVFHNPNATVEPKLLGREEVVGFAELRAQLGGAPGEPEGALVGLLRWLGLSHVTAEQPTEAVEALCASLSALGTWDTLELHGGRVLSGDVLGGGDADLIVNDLRLTDRERFAAVEVRASRSLLRALFAEPDCELTFVGRDGRRLGGKAPAKVAVKFHEVGQRAPTLWPLGQLTRIVYGSRLSPHAHLTWAELSEGRRLHGEVTGVSEHGVFVDFGGPRDGLIHRSRLHGRSPDAFARGDRLEVEIIEVDTKRQRIGLALK